MKSGLVIHHVVLASVLAAMLLGCGDDGSSAACTPGESVACVGPGGCSGGQACMPDGTGFGPCDCGSTDAGGAEDAGSADAGHTDDAGAADAGSSGDSGAGDAGPDAGPPPDPDDCDPVTDTGCPTGEKCSWRTDLVTVGEGITTCVPEGTAALGEACTTITGSEGKYDDCEGGTLCTDSVCKPICDTTDDMCGPDQACIPYTGVFSDRDGLGVCEDSCDVLAQDCSASGEGCYISLATGNTTCSPPTIPTGTGMQGEECPYLNACAEGYGCVLLNEPVSATGLECAYFCDASGAGGPSCTDAGGPGSGYACASLRDFYSDTPDTVPTNVGMCVSCTEWPSTPGCS